MYPYQIFFYGALFFLGGVLLKSLGWGVGILYLTAVLAGVGLFVWFFTKNKRFLWFALMVPVVLVGALYYQWDHNKFLTANVPYGDNEVSGVVADSPVVVEGRQRFEMDLAEPYSGKVFVQSAPYPEYGYGDRLKISGNIQEPPDNSYGDYLVGKSISGTLFFPEILRLSESEAGTDFKALLLSFGNKARSVYNRVLPPEQSALLGGVTFGGYHGMTEEFRDVLQDSGTTHLVALSGLHVTILIAALVGLFLYFFSRRISLVLTVLAMVAFVLMTGARPSIIRASIMGFLAAFAGEVGRQYDTRNAILTAGLLMVLVSPKVLVFDLGFQLSFLALLGIVYFKPILRKMLKMSESPGFFAWRENFLTTASAQLTVAPLLITSFGELSITSLFANTVVLELIPLTMGLGFLMALAGVLSMSFAMIVGWLAFVVLSFEIGVMKLFAGLNPSLGLDMGLFGALVYYAMLILVIYYGRKAVT